MSGRRKSKPGNDSASQASHPALSLWFSAPRTTELRERPARSPRANEVRVRALCSAISHGTEMLVYRGEVPRDLQLDLMIPTMEGSYGFPIKYGYASVGRVIEAGRGVGHLNEGDLVFAFNPHETDYTIPDTLAVTLPEETDPQDAVFFANLETALNALLDVRPVLGERVVIFGQGVVGLLITRLARRAGAGLIIVADLFARRRALGVALGATLALDPADGDVAARVFEATGGAGADVVIEASGQPEALNEAIKSTAVEGRVVVVSWYGTKRADLDLGSAFHRNRITIKSSQVSNMETSIMPRWTNARRRELALSYLSEFRPGELISHRFQLEDAASAYRLIDERPEEAVQVILDFRGIED